MTDAPPRLFTLEQANATLPLVRRIVDDLLELHPRWRVAVSHYEALQGDATAVGETEEAREARIEAGRLAGEIETCLDELDQIGCLFKGFDGGLVDFTARLDDRLVYLCWRHGEPIIEYWHELDGGFGGRLPLDPSLFPVTAS